MSKRLNMSNDEAVEWLLSLKNLDICGENRKTAIDKAIQALEAQPSEEDIHREREQAYMLGYEDASKKFRTEPCEDCISREEAKQFLYERIDRLNDDELYDIFSRIIDDMYNELPPVKPKYTDEEIDKAQAVEQAYVDKMVELAVEETRREWLNSSDTNSATECFTAVNLLKERLSDGRD